MTLLPDEKRLKKMQPVIKAKWLAALRSKKYRRAQEQLKKGRGYCCLGVLCHAMEWDFEPDEGEPSPERLTQAGLSTDAVAVLIRLNDGTLEDSAEEFQKLAGKVKGYRRSKGAGFARIADFIEEKL